MPAFRQASAEPATCKSITEKLDKLLFWRIRSLAAHFKHRINGINGTESRFLRQPSTANLSTVDWPRRSPAESQGANSELRSKR